MANVRKHFTFVCFAAAALCVVNTCAKVHGRSNDVSRHSVVWTDLLPEPGLAWLQSKGVPTYHNAMPLGNGHVGSLLNYEAENDTIAIMVAASSSWAESGEFLKVALLEISLPKRQGAPLSPGFRQVFNPQDATIQLDIPAGGQAPPLQILAYIDASSDNVVLSISPATASVSARLVALRPTPRVKRPGMDCQPYQVSADVTNAAGNLVYHRNSLAGANSYMVKTFQHLNMPLVPGFVDPLENRTTGLLLARTHATRHNTNTTVIVATLLTAHTDTAAEFEDAIGAASEKFLAELRGSVDMLPPPSHTSWWAAKWAGHSIELSAAAGANARTAADTARLSQLYVLQRFIELSQARSPYPSTHSHRRTHT